MFEFHFFDFRYSKLDEVRFVVRRVVVLGIAGGQLNIRFRHCTSCLFDNSSVKLCKARHAVPFVPQGTNDEQGLGQARPNKMCIRDRGQELRSEQTVTPLHEQNNLYLFFAS